jgi:hypothetical protein
MIGRNRSSGCFVQVDREAGLRWLFALRLMP